MSAMDNLSRNLKFLLSEKGVVPSEWARALASALSCSPKRAQALLDGEKTDLNREELQALGELGGIEPDRLLSADLLHEEGVNIFSRNLSFLIDSLPHGQKKHFAESLGVEQTTVSRWGKGTQRPAKSKVGAILDYFNLPRTTDLKKEPLFLSITPIGEAETKKWLKGRIDELDSETLRSLTPALIMLLKGKQ